MGDQKNRTPTTGLNRDARTKNRRARMSAPGSAAIKSNRARDQVVRAAIGIVLPTPRAKAERSVTGSPNLASRISKTSIGR